MTTLIIHEDSAEARKFIEFAKTLPFVEEEITGRIPGLPYTKEERLAAIRRAEEDYAAGRFVTSDELKAKHPRV